MKSFRTIGLGLVLGCFATGAGHAQNVFYTWTSYDLGDNAQSDSIIRETRKGDEVVAAEIDLCFQREFQGKWDRIVVPLKVDGGKFSASGTSQIKKIPVAIDLTKRRDRAGYAYSGTIKIADRTAKVEQDSVFDRKLEEITESQTSTALLVENPADFSAVQPNVVAVRVKRGELKSVFAALRGEPLVIDTNYGLIEDCNALRTGHQTIQFTTPAEGAAALVAKLRKHPGVLAVGWGGYGFRDTSVRIASAGWIANGKIDRDKISAELAKILSRSVGAKFLSSSWEANTGVLVQELVRPSVRFQDAGFSEAVTVRILVSHERLSSQEYLVISVLTVTANLLDEVSGPRLDIPPFHEVGGEGYVPPELTVAAIAKDLRGMVWESGPEKWVEPQ
jgi:hypothetical protein